MKNNQDYTALYLPALEDGEQNPSKSGFRTPELAEKYIRKHQCKDCKELYAKYLKWQKNECKPTYDDFYDQKMKKYDPEGKINSKNNLYENDIYFDFEDLYGTSNTGCFCEWLIIETKKLEKCNDFGDIMEASGAERIWKKGEEKC